MNKNILNSDIQYFIDENLNSDINNLLLKRLRFNNIETREVIEQIEAKKKCLNKLPTWFNTKNIYYPNKLNIEQTSSEITAKYKAQLVKGESIIDLTGGFGVDCHYFSKHFKTVTHCEINSNLSDIVTYNSKLLNNSITTINDDGINYLKSKSTKYDYIYIDPSRRNKQKGKVFFLDDCLPNVPQHLELLFKHTNNIMIKTSPLLDISIGLKELNHVKTIHVVAVNNEVKELLWILEKGFNKNVSVATINIVNTKQELFNFLIKDETNLNIECGIPQNYLYEPNAAILKSGAFKSLAKHTNTLKLHTNSHLYTHSKAINFPGRQFKIEKILPYNKQLLKKESFTKANISVRNFPETVQQIRKKFKISDGGNLYLFFTTNSKNKRIVIVSYKLNQHQI
ncbi:THUMP-like domain-containing protein [Ichthyenterobacterium magnum]|uniref:Uncharacterized protein n=1 Tax=Ichthyenterobacterium magnum TaxID=1230530 RepID=A0A420DMH3_9FLAO|nr:class I SAM-dependent methyltransferase [Ichthyenterobacterium magnum]RKE95442.1 hypothetical protein BXY80_1629 [Ichthyenterobacterium magnum]